jgi:protein-S-isoprenylcysteine O-methyltransferase Ste14
MNTHHPSPHTYVLCTLAAVIGGVVAFKYLGYHDHYFFLLIFAVAAMWAGVFWRRQLRGESHFSIDRGSTLQHLVVRALARYLVWLAILAMGLTFYQGHPYYRDYDKSSQFLSELFELYWRFGLPYFLLTLKFKASRVEDYYDPAIRLLLIAKWLIIGTWSNPRRLQRVLRNRANRKALLNIVMRAYFIPIMVVQVYTGLRDAVGMSSSAMAGVSFLATLTWITAMLWLADSLSASTGYALESRWLENRSRSVDLTVSGWIICLCCYPPLNQVSGILFPFGPLLTSSDPNALIIPSTTLLYGLKITEVILLGALVYSDLSLGPSGVNITLKKLQTKGPYGIVRHPGTVCKLSFWWIQCLFYVDFWTPAAIAGQLLWNVIYILRALSEERHLRQFPEYREYMKTVRYRFIPGVV